MSAKPRPVQEINLDEFERRLRIASASQNGAEDPLAELTRLVNSISAEPTRDDKVVDLPNARDPSTVRLPKAETPPVVAPPVAVKPPAPVPAPAPVAISPAPPPSPPPAPAAAPPAPPPAPVAVPLLARPAPQQVVIDSRAAITSAISDERLTHELRRAIEEPEAEADEPPAEASSQPSPADPQETPFGYSEIVDVPTGRSRSWYLKVGGLTAVGLVLAASAVAMKVSGVPGLPKTPPVIHAADGPVKVAPPSEAAVQSPGDSGALLTKDSASPTPVKLVSHEEQPVDLASKTPTPTPTPSAATPAATASSTPAAALGAPVLKPGVSPVAPTSDTPLVALSDNPATSSAPASAPPVFPVAKGVRTVSVRPDGTLIATATVDAAAPTPTPTPSPSAVSATRGVDLASPSSLQPSTPNVDLPPAKPTPKSSARVIAAKTDTTVSADGDAMAPALAPSKPDKPAKLPTKLRPPAADKTDKADAAVVANNAPPATTPAAEPGAGGGWAVQLGAPRSEGEAQSAISRLQSKYASELGGASLGVHKAEVNGETIYRVRAGGLSKADAAALCSKIKASGGDCFIARK